MTAMKRLKQRPKKLQIRGNNSMKEYSYFSAIIFARPDLKNRETENLTRGLTLQHSSLVYINISVLYWLVHVLFYSFSVRALFA